LPLGTISSQPSPIVLSNFLQPCPSLGTIRLLNVFTMEVKEFLGYKIPFHAILSHTWGKEEVTFNNIMASNVVLPDDLDKLNPWENDNRPSVSGPAPSLEGFQKLMSWCEKAKEDCI
jgi:hypothetical protein